MKIYIPSVGDELRLTSDWTFGLYNEDRNSTLMEVLKDTRPLGYTYSKVVTIDSIPATIPAGEILKVDRIYIRKGKEEFDSITFYWKNMRTEPRIEEHPIYPTPGVVATREIRIPRYPVRFWVKLDDANKIEFDLV